MRRSVALLALATSAATAAPAEPGRYAAEFCVATQPQAAPTCGTAEVDVAPSRISVRVADIVYRLALGAAQLDVATMHGAMQIDEFSAAYRWEGTILRFSDVDKDVRYEVRIGARKGQAGPTGAPPSKASRGA